MKHRWEDCEKQRLTQATVCRKTAKRAGEERMLPKHLCARKLQEANSQVAKSNCVREDCETKTCEVQVERLRKRRLTQAAVCRKTAEKDGRRANAAKRDRMQEDCENRDV